MGFSSLLLSLQESLSVLVFDFLLNARLLVFYFLLPLRINDYGIKKDLVFVVDAERFQRFVDA